MCAAGSQRKKNKRNRRAAGAPKQKMKENATGGGLRLPPGAFSFIFCFGAPAARRFLLYFFLCAPAARIIFMLFTAGQPTSVESVDDRSARISRVAREWEYHKILAPRGAGLKYQPSPQSTPLQTAVHTTTLTPQTHTPPPLLHTHCTLPFPFPLLLPYYHKYQYQHTVLGEVWRGDTIFI